MSETKIEINPSIPWNPQREDYKTPLLQIPDWSECMGNSVQSSVNWIGDFIPELKLLGATAFNTYNYYAVFEPWLEQKKLIWKDKNGIYQDPNLQVYTLSNHINCMNEMLRANKCKYIFTYYGTASIFAVCDHIEKYKRPVVLGTKLSGDGGHIIRIVGFNKDDKGNIVSLIVSDPYGEYPYKTQIQKKDGHYKIYPCDYKANTLHSLPITRMVTIDEVK